MKTTKFEIRIAGQAAVPFECETAGWRETVKRAALTLLRFSRANDDRVNTAVVVAVEIGVIALQVNLVN